MMCRLAAYDYPRSSSYSQCQPRCDDCCVHMANSSKPKLLNVTYIWRLQSPALPDLGSFQLWLLSDASLSIMSIV